MGRNEGQEGLTPLFESMYTALWPSCHVSRTLALRVVRLAPGVCGLSEFQNVYRELGRQMAVATHNTVHCRGKAQQMGPWLHLSSPWSMLSALGRCLEKGSWTVTAPRLGLARWSAEKWETGRAARNLFLLGVQGGQASGMMNANQFT